MMEAGERVQLIDVREPHEYALCRIEGAELFPLRSIPHSVEALRQRAAAGPLVLYCHHGVRSLQAVAWLRRQGVAECRSLEGGIDLWSTEVDASVKRY